MNIHPFWYICLVVRTGLIFLLRYLSKSKFIASCPTIKIVVTIILLIMGLGFMYNGIFGSNNEVQLAKVFWHETRFVHGVLYILASYFFYIDNIDMNSLVLATDIIFSIMYRIYTNQ
jgi:hypothetical protein